MRKETFLEAAPALAAIARKYAPTVAAFVAPIIAEKIGPKVLGGKPAIGTRRRDLGVIVFRDLIPALIDVYEAAK
ncbi:hypothetical protein KA005_55520 [bacterium]|nr:hypothetical protein [bacterium]